VKDRISVDVQYAAYIRTSVGVDARIYINTAGRILKSYDYYTPRLSEVADVVYDSQGKSTCTFTIVNNARIPVYLGASATWESYDNLGLALKAYPSLAIGGVVQLYCEERDELGAVTLQELFKGTISRPASATPTAFVFEGEQRNALTDARTPTETLTVAPPTISDAVIIPAASGATIPIHLGAFRSKLAGIDDDLSWWYNRNMAVFGLKQPVAQTVPWFLTGANNLVSRLGHCVTKRIGLADPTPGWGGAFIDAGDGVMARIYSSWADNGNWWTGRGWAVDDTHGPQRWVTHNRFPWVQVPISLNPVEGANLVQDQGIAEGKKTQDGNPNTWAVLPSGKRLTFEIINPKSLPGRLCCNSTDAGTNATVQPKDYEGTGLPVGLKLVVLAALPNAPGIVNPTGTNTVEVKFCFPDETTWLASYTTRSFTPPKTFDAIQIKTFEINLPYDTGLAPGNAGAGWVNTKFADGDFTTSPSSTGADATLFYVANQTKPFKVAIKNLESSAPIYLVSVKLIAGCRMAMDPADQVVTFSYKRHRHLLAGFSPFRVHKRRAGYKIELPESWGAMYDQRKLEKPPVSSIYTCFQYYVDDASGTYTGSASRGITDPIHHAMFLMATEGKIPVADMATGAGDFGSVVIARDLLSRWWRGGVADPVGWPMNVSLTADDSVDAWVQALGEHCLDLKVRRMPSGKYGFFVWAPIDLNGVDNYAYVSGAAGTRTTVGTPAAPERAIITGKQVIADPSGFSMELWSSPFREVVNRIQIRYGSGLFGLAECDKDGSDDGTGLPWGYNGVVPFSGGLTAQQLCQWSVQSFGEAPEPLRLDLPGVDNPQVAVQIGLYYLCRKYRPEWQWRATCNVGLLDAWPGHILRFDDEVLSRANFRFPLDGSTYGKWSDKFFLVEESEHRASRGSIQVMSGVVLPKDFNQEMVSGKASEDGGPAPETLLGGPPAEGEDTMTGELAFGVSAKVG
jgi:hypothetical protein